MCLADLLLNQPIAVDSSYDSSSPYYSNMDIDPLAFEDTSPYESQLELQPWGDVEMSQSVALNKQG